MSNELKIAIKAARAGAKKAISYFNTDIHVEIKSDNSPVTIADKETEKAIRTCITSAFPHAKFVGEEGGGSKSENEFWTIDPIDGTKFFIHGIPLWSTLISLYRKGNVVLGVSYTPQIEELLYSEKGKGTYLGKRQCRVSKIDRLEKSFIVYTDIRRIPSVQNLLTLLEKSAYSATFLSAFGYHLVANGRAECFIDPNVKIWDIAPFKVIIEEAGGRITDVDGREWNKNSTGAVATNGRIHDEVVRILNQ